MLKLFSEECDHTRTSHNLGGIREILYFPYITYKPITVMKDRHASFYI